MVRLDSCGVCSIPCDHSFGVIGEFTEIHYCFILFIEFIYRTHAERSPFAMITHITYAESSGKNLTHLYDIENNVVHSDFCVVFSLFHLYTLFNIYIRVFFHSPQTKTNQKPFTITHNTDFSFRIIHIFLIFIFHFTFVTNHPIPLSLIWIHAPIPNVIIIRFFLGYRFAVA